MRFVGLESSRLGPTPGVGVGASSATFSGSDLGHDGPVDHPVDEPVGQGLSAVNQRSRSESSSIRSIGWPVWNAMRSAIIRLR